MRRILRFPLTVVLTSSAAILVVAVLLLSIIGTFVGLFKELFKYYSTILTLGLTEFRTSKTIDGNALQGEARKIFDLRMPGDARSSEVIYVRDK